MNLEELASRHKILEIKVGSHLYGTNTPESDIDFCGVFVATKDFYLGLRSVKEVDLSVVSKKENGRNDKDAIDRKFYELRKYIDLAKDNNPNIIEQLFVNSDNIIFANPLGQKLLENRHLFPYQGCYHKFIGYSFSQKKKMIIKRDNMQDIIKAIEFYEKLEDKNHTYVVQYDSELFKDTGQHIRIGDMHLQKNDTIKQALRKLYDRKNKFSGRYNDFVSKSGYDTKFASHLIRLLYEGMELLETGKIEFPLKQAKLLLDIKNGNFTIDEIMNMATDLEDDIRVILEKSDLPKRPRIKEIENLLIEMVEESWS